MLMYIYIYIYVYIDTELRNPKLDRDLKSLQ